MAPTLSLLACRDVALSLQFAFVPALLVTGGGPDRATTFLPLLVYRNAFENGRYGYAAAITVVVVRADAGDRRHPAAGAAPRQTGRIADCARVPPAVACGCR